MTALVRRVPDRLLLVACSASALVMALVTDANPHRIWGITAGVGYLVVAVSPLGRRPAAPWAAGVAAGIVPLGVLVAARATAGPGGPVDRFAQIEVRMVEAAANRWVATGSPWPTSGAGMDGFFPYLPTTALPGLPRAVFGDVWWTDARIVFLLVVLGCLAAAVRLVRPVVPGRWAGWLVAGNPLVALTAATGGHDLVMAALLVLAFAAGGRLLAGAGTGADPAAGATVRAVLVCGTALGAALCTKPTAWPAAVVLGVVLWRRVGPRTAAATCAVTVAGAAALLVPALLRAGPALVVRNTVLFPAQLTDVPMPATSPLPGTWLAALPHGQVVALAALVLAAVLLVVRLVRRPPSDLATTAGFAALALAAAISLVPASRMGWLVAPILLLAVTASVRAGRRRAENDSG